MRGSANTPSRLTTATRRSASIPKSAEAYCYRAAAFIEKEDYAKAIDDCTEAIRLDPKSADAYTYRGIAHGRKGEYAKSIADWDEVIRLQPNSAHGYVGRSYAPYWNPRLRRRHRRLRSRRSKSIPRFTDPM